MIIRDQLLVWGERGYGAGKDVENGDVAVGEVPMLKRWRSNGGGVVRRLCGQGAQRTAFCA